MGWIQLPKYKFVTGIHVVHGARSNHKKENISERIYIISNTRTGRLEGGIKAIIKMPSGKRAGRINRSQSKEVS